MRKLKITELNRLTNEEFQEKEKLPLIVVLDNVRSLFNVGSVFRTSDAFLIEEIFLCGITSTPPHTEIHKTALGAETTVKWRYFQKTEDAVSYLKNENWSVVAIEQVEGSTMLSDFDFNANGKLAVVFGNEVKGVQQSVVNLCDNCIEIPQFGTKHSLNISVTAGIVIWEFAKNRL
jgi:tRNA G18 (ribose-2'-O)-methylase SpoU